MGKYSFIIYWTIAQKLIIMNQTTNFTILSRIWNHDFYITQKSNFCTAGHKYLNKRVLRKNIFFKQVFILNSSGSPRRLKQFWCDFPQASLVVLPIWQWQNAKIKGGTLLRNIDEDKRKETKEILPIYLSSRSSARCLLRWALRILLPNSYDFPAI